MVEDRCSALGIIKSLRSGAETKSSAASKPEALPMRTTNLVNFVYDEERVVSNVRSTNEVLAGRRVHCCNNNAAGCY